MPPNPRLQRFLKFFSMEWGLLLGILCASFGFILFTPPFMDWKNAGFQEDDLIVSYDGRSDLMTDSDMLRYGATQKKLGQTVVIGVLRKGESHSLKIPVQP